MKKIFAAFLLLFVLCGCSVPQNHEAEAISAPEPTMYIKARETIAPFEKKTGEILPLPEEKVFTDSMELVDSIMANYEMLHFAEFETDFELRDMQPEKNDDGYMITSQKAKNETMTSDVGFSKPLDEYFDTPHNSYGVLVRFKTENADELMFNFDSKFGRIMLDFADGMYPAIDVAGDSYGDPMLGDDWNNYLYEANEWAYVFMTITNIGQKSCYVWAEDSPNDYNFTVSYGEDLGGENLYMFSIEVFKKGESVTVSDIWLYSYEEAKR